jgi:hypothetical protein
MIATLPSGDYVAGAVTLVLALLGVAWRLGTLEATVRALKDSVDRVKPYVLAEDPVWKLGQDETHNRLRRLEIKTGIEPDGRHALD